MMVCDGDEMFNLHCLARLLEIQRLMKVRVVPVRRLVYMAFFALKGV